MDGEIVTPTSRPSGDSRRVTPGPTLRASLPATLARARQDLSADRRARAGSRRARPRRSRLPPPRRAARRRATLPLPAPPMARARDTRGVREPDALLGPLEAIADRALAVGRGEPLETRGVAEGQPRLHDG